MTWVRENLNLEVLSKELSHILLRHFGEIQTELGHVLIQLFEEGTIVSPFPDAETEAFTHTADRWQGQDSNWFPLSWAQDLTDFQYYVEKYIS